MLEMALCISIVLFVVLGIMEFSLALYADHFVEAAAGDAVRYAMVRGSTYSGTACTTATTYSCEAIDSDIVRYVRNLAPPGIDASKLTINVSWPGDTGGGAACDNTDGNNSPGCTVIVSVAYPFSFMLPAPVSVTTTLRAISSTVISQ